MNYPDIMAQRSKNRSETRNDRLHRKKILEAYADYWTEYDAAPASVASFCKKLKLKEAEFYKCFASLESVEKNIWRDWIDSVITAVSSGKEWKSFSARERYLAFLFSLFHSARDYRSLLLQRTWCWVPLKDPVRLQGLRASFMEFAQEIIEYGEKNGEIAYRPGIKLLYPGILYMHLRWVLDFYLKDESDLFERTDAFIEKTVTVAFELFRTQAIDSATDLFRFLFSFSGRHREKRGE